MKNIAEILLNWQLYFPIHAIFFIRNTVKLRLDPVLLCVSYSKNRQKMTSCIL